jgi:hypothetical protein
VLVHFLFVLRAVVNESIEENEAVFEELDEKVISLCYCFHCGEIKTVILEHVHY